MAKTPNYDDLAGFETPAQRKTKAQVAQLMADMKRIDDAVADGTFEQLKALHVELDGTYQNRIKNWGTSMYNYMQGMGFIYDYAGEDALRENLTTMKGKLRGLLFEIDPSAEEKSPERKEVSVGEAVTIAKSETRANMYDIIKKRKFDVAKEYARIWKLFNTGGIMGPSATPLSMEINYCIQFFPDSFKNRALTLADFNDTYGFDFQQPNDLITTDELISYCEYVITLCDHLWEYADVHLENDSEYLRDDLYHTVASCMDELGFESVKRDFITIYVQKDPTVVAVADLVDES